MASPQVSRTVDFSKGIYANVNRFMQPPGTVRRLSNWVFDRDGALLTVDGSRIVSSYQGGPAVANQQPIRFIGRYAPSGGGTYNLALQAAAPSVNVLDVTSDTWSTPAYTATSSYQNPSFVQAGDYIAVALGAGATPALLSGHPLSSTVWSNTWTSNPNIPIWLPSVGVEPGQSVRPTTANGHIYVAIQSNNAITGSTEPTWPTSPNGMTYDGTTLWQEAGGTTPPPPPGADFFFFHAGFLWAWGTSTGYVGNLDGPDALRMSDMFNFTSWNPLNMTYVGKGDGTKPMGGAVMTLSETGIEATNQLILFKQASTYIILGTLGPGASAKKAPTGVGCVAPLSIQFIEELGIVRLSQRGIAVFDGQNDQVEQYTNPIKAYLFGGMQEIIPIDWGTIQFARGARVNDPPCYILACPLAGTGISATIGSVSVAAGAVYATVNFPAGGLPLGNFALMGNSNWNTTWWLTNVTGSGFQVNFGTPAPAGATFWWGAQMPLAGGCTRIFVYHLTLKAWAVVDLPWSISALAYIPENPYPNFTLSGGTNDGTIRRLFAGDPDWDGTPINGMLTLPEIGNPASPAYVKEVAINGRAERGVQCGFTNAVLAWLDRDGVYHNENLFIAGSQIPVHVTIDKTLTSCLLTLLSTGPMCVEGVEIPSQPKRYTKWNINRDGGNTTLNPPGAHGTTTVPMYAQGVQSVTAGTFSTAISLPVTLTTSNYMVTAAPSWPTNRWVSAQGNTNFTVAWDTPPPAGASIMWTAAAPTALNQVGSVNVAAGGYSAVCNFTVSLQQTYTPLVMASWNTSWWITGITPGGFSVAFNTPAPAGGGVCHFRPEVPL